MLNRAAALLVASLVLFVAVTCIGALFGAQAHTVLVAWALCVPALVPIGLPRRVALDVREMS